MTKFPPQNGEIEQMVIGCLLINKDVIFKIIDFLNPDDFYFEKNAILYEVYLKMFNAGKKIDLIILVEELENKGFLEAITRSYITSCYNSVATPSHILDYALIVKDKSIRRKLLTSQQENEVEIYNENLDINQVLATTQNRIFEVSNTKPRNDSVQFILNDLEKLQAEYSQKYEQGLRLIGYSCGIPKLDNITDGLRPGHFWVVGGFRGTGKTFFALNIINNLLKQGVPVGIITLEMSQIDLIARLIGINKGFSAMKIIKGIHDNEEFQLIKNGKEFLDKQTLEIHQEYDLEKIKLLIRKDVYVKKVKVVMIDYIQKIMMSDLNEETALMSRISIQLANLAQQLKITIILLSQVSNQSEAVRTPGGGFKGSGTIEEVADLAIRLRRDKDKENKEAESVPIKICITKNKYGFDGIMDYFIHLPTGIFSEEPL